MSYSDFGKAIERLLRSADNVAITFSGDSSLGAEAKKGKAYEDYNKCMKTFNTITDRLEALMNGTSKEDRQEQAACARAWLSVYLQRKLFPWIQNLLHTVRQQASVATSPANPAASRLDASVVVLCAGQAAFLLINHASIMPAHAGSSKADQELAHKVTSALAQRGFVGAVADAARAMAATAAALRSEATARDPTGELGTLSYEHDVFVVKRAAVLCQYAKALAQEVYDQVKRDREEGGSGSGGTRQQSVAQFVPSSVSHLIEALVDSELLAAAASAVLDSPNVLKDEQCPSGTAKFVCRSVLTVTVIAADVMGLLQTARTRLAGRGGAEPRRLAVGLLRAARHEAVQRLQVALLDQLAARAGLGADVDVGVAEEWEVEGRGARGSEQEQQRGAPAGACWGRSIGTWWFAKEEACQRHTLGLENDEEVEQGGGNRVASRLPKRLEYHFGSVVRTTLYEWASTDAHLAAEGGVPVAPPPLLAARLASRAAEALCRLYRGQGLVEAPEWDFAMQEALGLSEALPGKKAATLLSAATAQACLPHWLEAAGWAAALVSDAIAAAMGRSGAAQQHEEVAAQNAEPHDPWDDMEASALRRLWRRARDWAEDGSFGYATLSAAAQADLRRRLFRCGLAASLDHTLRLGYSAQDGNHQGSTAQAAMVVLCSATLAAEGLASIGLLPLLPPATQGGGVSGGHAGTPLCTSRTTSSSSSNAGAGAGGAGGGETAGHQLGLLYTLSKRAALLARALGAMAPPGTCTAGSGTREREDPNWELVLGLASEVVVLMNALVVDLIKHVGHRVQAARESAAAVQAGGSGGSGGSVGGDGGAACEADAVYVDEAHEALALAARAVSNLAAVLAWHMATGRPQRESGALAACARLVHNTLAITAKLWSSPQLLPPAQLLACQPHRLLVADCALAVELPVEDKMRGLLGCAVASTVVTMCAHKTLSGRVHGWLAPPPSAASTSTCPSVWASGGGAEGHHACAGCLAGPLRAAMRGANGWPVGRSRAMQALALLRLAAREPQPERGVHSCPGVRDATGDADGAFQQRAEAMRYGRLEGSDRPSLGEADEVLLPDGSSADNTMQQGGGGDGLLDPADQSALSWPLPPPLALPPCREAVLPRLRVCGNPRCSNFAGECEGALPLKQCGGCRAVRYCGADCQRAHWREGHKAECKVLAVGVAKGV